MNVSVCMATYNGGQYVERQLVSILEQLDADDEIVVVDDSSKDNTLEIVRGLEDPRIRVFQNSQNRGEVFSFDRALSLARHELIFLADQDDVWLPGRVSLMTRELEAGAVLVASNFEWMDSNESPIVVPFDGVRACDSQRNLKNIVDILVGKTNYFGCAMAFHRKLVSVVSPIPWFVESHDWWIAIAANLLGSTAHLEEKTFRKRKHASNATSTVSNRSLYKKIRSRVWFFLGAPIVAARLMRGRASRGTAAALAKRAEARSSRS